MKTKKIHVIKILYPEYEEGKKKWTGTINSVLAWTGKLLHGHGSHERTMTTSMRYWPEPFRPHDHGWRVDHDQPHVQQSQEKVEPVLRSLHHPCARLHGHVVQSQDLLTKNRIGFSPNTQYKIQNLYCLSLSLSLSLCSSIGGVAYVTVFNSSATWAATFHLWGTSACWLFLCFHNPPNSNMDYRIFKVCTWPFVSWYACIYTRGLGTLTASQHSLFDLEKLKVFCVLVMGFEPSTVGSPVQRSNHWANPSPP